MPGACVPLFGCTHQSKWLTLYVKWKAARSVAKRDQTRYRLLKNVSVKYMPIVVQKNCLRLVGKAGGCTPDKANGGP